MSLLTCLLPGTLIGSSCVEMLRAREQSEFQLALITYTSRSLDTISDNESTVRNEGALCCNTLDSVSYSLSSCGLNGDLVSLVGLADSPNAKS
jgi:hypothetical protein